MKKYDYLYHTHDLPSLSDWGPYARDVYALSHIADYEKGLRFDFFMVPGIFRRQFYWPDPLRENGCSPIEASSKLRHFAFRQQLEGMDRFFCDMSYTQIENDLWLGRCHFVNRTKDHHSAALLLYTRISPRQEVVPVMPENCSFIDGLDHSVLEYAVPRYDHNLTSSGGRRGEEPRHGTVGSTCLGKPHYDGFLKCFGENAGDRVTYKLPDRQDGVIFLRALVAENISWELKINIAGKEFIRQFTGSGNFALFELYRGKLLQDDEISITSCGVNGGLRIDGIIIGDAGTTCEDISFQPVGRAVEPQCVTEEQSKIDTFSGSGLNKSYAVWWNCNESARREYWLRDLAHLVSYSNNLRHPFYYSFPNTEIGNEYCRDIYTLPIEIPAGESKTFYTLYCAGKTPENAKTRVQNFSHDPEILEKIFVSAHRKACYYPSTNAGKKYRFGRMMMAAASLTNINFPVRAEGKNIRHHVPDKHFNSLYSWDSGFIGLGFLEIDQTRAIENLNVYLTEPENEVNAFMFHGTPLPVQAYLYWELFNRTQEKELLKFFYPKLRHFYDFLAGHIPTSIFRKAKSNLLRPWEYTYNSGGWDDYPPQWEIILTKDFSVAPVVTTAHQIRFAKIMRRAAILLDKTSDVAVYDADINSFAEALQKYSYDEKNGIFSFVEHDADGNPTGFHLDPISGVNYNLGMDGVSPLVSGICTAEQRNEMFARLADKERMWTPIGISTVDKQAPYYRTDGYWNGAVWMPHQWFFWKAALDDNRPDFARRIALTALELWEKELRRTRYCFEHFCLSSQQGAGCCHFGGLSLPVLNWFAAYCVKGSFNCGYDTWVLGKKNLADKFTADLLIEGDEGEQTTILYVNGANKSQASFNGKTVPCSTVFPGCCEVVLPKNSAGILEIIPEK